MNDANIYKVEENVKQIKENTTRGIHTSDWNTVFESLIFIYVLNRLIGLMVACSARLEVIGSIPSRVKSKTSKLTFAASLLSTFEYGDGSDWLVGFGIVCFERITYHPAECYFVNYQVQNLAQGVSLVHIRVHMHKHFLFLTMH